jgi:hypothetical protein
MVFSLIDDGCVRDGVAGVLVGLSLAVPLVMGAVGEPARAIGLTMGAQPDGLVLPSWPSREPSGWASSPGTPNPDSGSDFAEAFSLDPLRQGETWVAVRVLAFVHDALEDVEMVRLPLDASPSAYDQIPASQLSGSSDPNAQSSGSAGYVDPVRSDIRMRVQRIQSDMLETSADRMAQRASEAREHALEARDATFARQLQAERQTTNDADADKAPYSPPPVVFDPNTHQLGYAQDYEDAVSEPDTGSGSYLVALGTWLVVLGLIQFGLRVLLARELS